MKRGKTVLEVAHFICSRKIPSRCYSVFVLCLLNLRFEIMSTPLSILWNNQQMRQCAVKFISLQVHSTCFGRHTRPSSGVQF